MLRLSSTRASILPQAATCRSRIAFTSYRSLQNAAKSPPAAAGAGGPSPESPPKPKLADTLQSISVLAGRPIAGKPEGPLKKGQRKGKAEKGAPNQQGKKPSDQQKKDAAKKGNGTATKPTKEQAHEAQVKRLESAIKTLKTVLDHPALKPKRGHKHGTGPRQGGAGTKYERGGSKSLLEAAGGKNGGYGISDKAEAGGRPERQTKFRTTSPKNGSSDSLLGEIIAPEGQHPGFIIRSIQPSNLKLTPIEADLQAPVPKLQYGLDRALFNPGVYHIQDPRSKVYNFDPYLATIMPLQEFDFQALKSYVTSSKDETLLAIAAKHQRKYMGSTSSMTAVLSHFHYLLSSWRPINPAHTSRNFDPESFNFTRINRAPAAAFLHHNKGSYAIDADKEYDTANILSMLGKSMEKLLTLPKESFERYRVTQSHEISEEERTAAESFHYTVFGDFMLRSQLDAYDARLPGSGMFDLKTRAVVSVRMDAKQFRKGMDYEIRSRIGQWESFEREYYDMIRSAFLKYSLQVRMGRMDGIFVAFHNTRRIFGFQYISINEMDLAIHGTEDSHLGDCEFKASLALLNQVLDRATARFPGRSLRLHVETRESDVAPFTYIFVKPTKPDEIHEVQNASKSEIEAFERDILGLAVEEAAQEEAEADAEEEDMVMEYDLGDQEIVSKAVWEQMRAKVEQVMENEAHGRPSIRDDIEDALEESGLLRARSPEESRRYIDALLSAITSPDTQRVAERIQRGSSPLRMDNPDSGFDGERYESAVQGATDDHESSSAADSAQRDEAASIGDGMTTTEGQDLSTAEVEMSESEPRAIRDEADGEEEREGEEEEEEEEVDAAPLLAEEQEADASTLAENSDIAYEDDAHAEASEVKESDLPLANISLKDLIIKLAGQLEASGLPKATKDVDLDSLDGADAATADAPIQNKRFERILSKLMAISKEPRDDTGSTATISPAAAENETASTVSSSSLSSSSPGSPFTAADTEDDELMGMSLTIRNKVNGRYVRRPEKLTSRDNWEVEYAIEDIPPKRAGPIYEAIKTRRRVLLSPDRNQDGFTGSFIQRLHRLSDEGRIFRGREETKARHRPIHVYGVDWPLRWTDVFGNKVRDSSKQKPFGRDKL